jgi:hypothetical protein
VPRVIQERPEHKVRQAQQVLKETPVRRDCKVLLELLVHLVLQA